MGGMARKAKGKRKGMADKDIPRKAKAAPNNELAAKKKSTPKAKPLREPHRSVVREEGGFAELTAMLKRTGLHQPALLSYAWIPLLMVIVFTGLWLRMTPVDYRLTAYDPFFMVRMSRDVEQTGSMPLVDTRAYFPLGRDTYTTRILTPMVIAKLHGVLSYLNPSYTVETSTKMYPAVMGGLTLLAFFFFAAELFSTETALLATFLLGTVQGFLYRTSANFSDKEGVAIFLMAVCLWFFAKALNAKERKQWLVYSGLSGLTLGLMGYAWGGYRLNYLSVSCFFLFQILRMRISRRHLEMFGVFILATSALIIGSYSTHILKDSPGLFAYGTFVFALVTVYIQERKVFTTPWLQLFSAAVITFIIGMVGLFIISNGNPTGLIKPVLNTIMGVKMQEGDVHRWSVGEQQRPVWAWPFTSGWKTAEGSTWWGHQKFLFPLFLIGLFVALAEGHILDNEHAVFAGAFMLMSFFVSFLMVRLHFPLCVPAALLSAYLLRRAWGPTVPQKEDEDGFEFSHYVTLAFIVFVIPLTILATLHTGGANATISPELSESAYVLHGWATRNMSDYVSSLGSPESLADTLTSVFVLSWLVFYLALLVSYVRSVALRNFAKKLIIAFFAFCLCSYTLIDGYAFVLGLNSSLDADWLDGLLWLKHHTPDDAIVMTWWDYGYWIQYVANRTTVTDGENRISNWNVDMGQFFQKTNSDDFFSFRKCAPDAYPFCNYVHPNTGAGEVFMDYHTIDPDTGTRRPAYIIIDNTLIGKFYWVTKIGDNCIAAKCGTQYQYFPIAQPSDNPEDQQLGAGVYMNYIYKRLPNGDVSQKVAQINLMFDPQHGGYVPIILVGGITPDGQFRIEEEAIIGKYMVAGSPTVFETQGIKEDANVFPGMIIIARSSDPRRGALYYVEGKTVDMLFTNLYFRDGTGINWVEKVHDSKPYGTVKVFKIKYPEDA